MRKQYYMEVEFVNMKKLFPDEKGARRGIRDFLDKKGFYIVLLLCIAVVAGTAVFVTTRNATSDKLDYDAQNIIPEEGAINSEDIAGSSLNAQGQTEAAAQVNGQNAAATEPDKATAVVDQAKAPVQTNDSEAKGNAPKPSAAPAKTTTPKTTETKAPAKSQSFVMPVTGEVTFEYAKDKLVYSKTLEEWRTHEGLDLAADRGTPVKATADGVVSEIKNDPRFGIIVIVDHKNGLKSVYSNLAADDMVTVNQKIKQGDIIGSVGNTASFESAEQSHLHFEVLKDNVNVDPVSYLPKATAAKN